MTRPLVVTRPLGGSPLGRAAAAGAVPDGWYAARPRSVAQWKARIEAVRRDSAVTGWWSRLSPALDASGPAAARLTRAAEGKGVLVTTGQQPGLFGGPVYTWSKALSALAFADALERACGIPVAPVFWAATDDADFEEARSTLVAVPGGVEELRLPDAAQSGIPMADVPLGDVSALLERLSSGAGSAASADVLDAVRLAYGGSSRTVGSAYVRLLRSVLEPLGIAVLDASHPSVRDAMHPVMVGALTEGESIATALEDRSAAIRTAGFEPQVDLVARLTLVSHPSAGGKERVSMGQARQAASDAPRGSLGPNVLLRPVAERAILPTVAYMAGPGEIAYFAQVGPVARALGIEEPLALPRWSCTIIEPHVARLLHRYGIAPDELAHENGVESRLARETMPPALSQSLSRMRERVSGALEDVTAAAVVDGTPLVDPRVVEGARIAIGHRVDRLERRLVAAIARRSVETARDVGTARGALFPRGVPQERALNFVPMLARQGPPLLEAMRAEAAKHAARLVTPDDGAGEGAESPTRVGSMPGGDRAGG